MNIPILNGWQVNKNISNSKLAVENSQYSLEGTKKQLYKNIQQAYTDAVAALRNIMPVLRQSARRRNRSDIPNRNLMLV